MIACMAALDEPTSAKSAASPDNASGIPGELRDALQLIATAFGLIAGITALLYIAGGAIVSLRLWSYGLPIELPVSELPQPLLVTSSLTEVLLPSVVVAVVYLSIRVVFWPRDPTCWVLGRSAADSDSLGAGWYASRIVLVIIMVVVALTGIAAFTSESGRSGPAARYAALFISSTATSGRDH
jgi:hypothetical protein